MNIRGTDGAEGPKKLSLPKMKEVRRTFAKLCKTVGKAARKAFSTVRRKKEPKGEVEQIDAFEGSLRPAQMGDGSHVEGSYAVDGKEYAKESVDRISTLDEFIQAKQDEMEACPGREQECRQQIAQAVAYRAANGRGWLDSNYYRDMVRDLPKTESRYDVPFKEEVYDAYLPCCVNMRVQSFESENESGSFIRTGVICDPRNGYIDLAQMKRIERLYDEGKEAEGNRELMRLQHQVRRYEIELGKGLSTSGRGAIEFAAKQLQNKESFTQAIQERRQALTSQALQLIAAQAKKATPEELADGKLTMLHLGLMNHQKEDIDKETGWAHFEGNELADMAAIFEELGGAQIICDGKGPFIDDEGKIHLPIERDDPLELNPIVANVTVQGHNANDGLQKTLNKKAFDQIDEALGELPEVFVKLKERLGRGESDLEIAEEFSEACLQAGLLLSMGCLSAKDRTGYVGSRMAARAADRAAQAEDASMGVRQKLARQVLSEKGCAAQVVFDNTGHTILKVSSARLPGITNSIKGVAYRTLYFGRQGSVALGIGDGKARERLKRARSIHAI